MGWKELEVIGREYGFPEQLHAQGFHQALGALGLFHVGGRL